MGEETYDLEGGDGAMAFSDKAVRRGFIKKVYAIISVQLLVTFGFVTLFNQSYEVKSFFLGGDQIAFWVTLGVCFFTSISIIIAMACVRSLRVNFPTNFILLAIFTISESITVGQACMLYDGEDVMIALGITALLVIFLTAFAFQTKIDFTLCRGVLAAVFFVFFFFGLGIAILPLFGVNIAILHLVYSAIGVLIFSVYLIYDTQMMMGGNHKFSISPEEYIFAAIAIYLDILNLFLHILKLVAAARRK